METKGQRHIRIYEDMKSKRSSLEAYWQELAYYGLPRKAYINRIYNLGDRLPSDIYDSTAIISLAYFAAGMQAYMSGPQTKWFTIGLRHKALMLANKAVRTYLKDAEDEIYHALNNSNFYQEDVESYLSLGSLGTDVLYGEEDVKETIRFDSLPIETVVVGVDANGRANKVYLEYEFDCEQAIGKFGKSAGTKAIECLNKGDFNTKFRYVFGVFPRDVYDASKKDALNMPFAALWIDRETKLIVREKGYKEFPFFVTRFAKGKRSPYGYSPEMNVFADIKMINAMEKTNILGAQGVVRPPLEVPDEAFLRPYNFNPGGMNIKNAGFPNEHITPINTGGNVKLGLEYVQYKQRGIQQAFYNDLFLLFEKIGSKMTAFEVSVRNNQRMQLLGSAIGNIMREKLSPVIERAYSILARNNRLPPLPSELRGEEYVIDYISPLARAQKALELQNLQQAMAIISSFGEVNMEVYDKIDFDETVDYVAGVTYIPPKILRDDAEVEDIRANRREQQAMVQQLAMLKEGADATKTGAEADKNIAQAQEVGAK